jgi:hypothetical protein
MSQDLLPCHCGGQAMMMVGVKGYTVWCNHCFSHYASPIVLQRDLAIRVWNQTQLSVG